MSPLIFLLLYSLPVSASGGLVFQAEPETYSLFGNLYAIGIDVLPFESNTIEYGITIDAFYKKSNPFHSDYFQDPGLSLKLLSAGIGPMLNVSVSDRFGIGSFFTLNHMRVTYPESGSGSTVETITLARFAWSYNLFCQYTFLSFKKIGLGAKAGYNYSMYGKSGNYYHDQIIVDYLVIKGLYLQIMIRGL